MAIRKIDEIMSTLRTRLGEDTTDDALSFIEDVSDTLNDYEQKAKGDGKDWKAEAERIDKEWREKYKNRFFSGSKDDDDGVDPDPEAEQKKYRFEDLFKEVGKNA